MAFKGKGAAYIDAAGPLGITNYPFTILTWIKRGIGGANADYVADLGHQSDYRARHSSQINDNGFPSAQSRNDQTFGTAVKTAGSWSNEVWYCQVCVFESATSRKVVSSDGAIRYEASNTTSVPFEHAGAPISTAGRFALGAEAYDFSDQFNGWIAEAAVWTSALSGTDIDKLLNKENPTLVASASLVAYWPGSGYVDGLNTYLEDMHGTFDLLLSGGATLDATQDPAIDPTVRAGVRITGIKEANEADTLVTDVINARVKVWYGSDDTGAEADLLTDVSITAGELSTGLNGDPPINTAAIVEVMWTEGTERKLLITDTTVVDLGA